MNNILQQKYGFVVPFLGCGRCLTNHFALWSTHASLGAKGLSLHCLFQKGKRLKKFKECLKTFFRKKIKILWEISVNKGIPEYIRCISRRTGYIEFPPPSPIPLSIWTISSFPCDLELTGFNCSYSGTAFRSCVNSATEATWYYNVVHTHAAYIIRFSKIVPSWANTINIERPVF